MRVIAFLSISIFVVLSYALPPEDKDKGQRIVEYYLSDGCGAPDKTVDISVHRRGGWSFVNETFTDEDGDYGPQQKRWIKVDARWDFANSFQSLFDFSDGIIICTSMRRKKDEADFPHWSNVTASIWKHFTIDAGRPSKVLRRTVHDFVTNLHTNRNIESVAAVVLPLDKLPVLKNAEDLSLAFQVRHGTQAFLDLMNSPNCLGQGHLIAPEHRSLFGKMIISNIAVQRVDEDAYTLTFDFLPAL